MLARTLGVNVQSSGGGPRNIDVMSTQSFAWSEASRVCGPRKISLYRNRCSRSVTYLELVPALVRECALVHVRRQAFEEPNRNVSVRERHGLAHESPRQVGAHLVRSLFEHGDLLAVDEAGDMARKNRTQCSSPKLHSFPIISRRSRDEMSPTDGGQRSEDWKRSTTADSQSRRSFSSVKIQGLMSAPRAIMMPSTPLCSTFSQYDRWSYASPLPKIGIGARSSSLTVSRRTLTHSPMSVSRIDDAIRAGSANERSAETYICSLRKTCSVADETDRASGEQIATE